MSISIAERTAFRVRTIDEFREFAKKPLPKPSEDWDLIWVLSGPEETIEETPETNQTRQRLLEGMELVRKVTALRTNSSADALGLEAIATHGPKIYFNGVGKQNPKLKTLKDSGFFETIFSFPGKNIIISTNPHVRHTKDQFTEFPVDEFSNRGYIVVVTHFYHMPRVIRYAQAPSNPIPQGTLVFYPIFSLGSSFADLRREVKKIPDYAVAGFFS